jgi:hypothetical protein
MIHFLWLIPAFIAGMLVGAFLLIILIQAASQTEGV